MINTVNPTVRSEHQSNSCFFLALTFDPRRSPRKCVKKQTWGNAKVNIPNPRMVGIPGYTKRREPPNHHGLWHPTWVTIRDWLLNLPRFYMWFIWGTFVVWTGSVGKDFPWVFAHWLCWLREKVILANSWWLAISRIMGLELFRWHVAMLLRVVMNIVKNHGIVPTHRPIYASIHSLEPSLPNKWSNDKWYQIFSFQGETGQTCHHMTRDISWLTQHGCLHGMGLDCVGNGKGLFLISEAVY